MPSPHTLGDRQQSFPKLYRSTAIASVQTRPSFTGLVKSNITGRRSQRGTGYLHGFSRAIPPKSPRLRSRLPLSLCVLFRTGSCGASASSSKSDLHCPVRASTAKQYYRIDLRICFTSMIVKDLSSRFATCSLPASGFTASA
jgi:hypothetical protein